MIAMPLFSRFVRPRRRLPVMGPLATAACAVLALTVLRPGLAGSLVIFSASAAFGAYQIAVNTAFVVQAPDQQRSQAFGVAATGIAVVQGASFLAAGAAAQLVTPAAVIAAAGCLGAAGAAALTHSWRRQSPPAGRHEAVRRPYPGHLARENRAG